MGLAVANGNLIVLVDVGAGRRHFLFEFRKRQYRRHHVSPSILRPSRLAPSRSMVSRSNSLRARHLRAEQLRSVFTSIPEVRLSPLSPSTFPIFRRAPLRLATTMDARCDSRRRMVLRQFRVHASYHRDRVQNRHNQQLVVTAQRPDERHGRKLVALSAHHDHRGTIRRRRSHHYRRMDRCRDRHRARRHDGCDGRDRIRL